MNILIAEDQTLLRDTLKSFLKTDHDFHKVSTVTNGQQALETVSSGDIDFIIMDIKMPIMSGIEATKVIKKKYSHIKILILTLYENEQDLIDSIQAGADGYLLKDVEPEILISSIKLISKGVSIVKKEILKQAFNRLQPLGEEDEVSPSINFSISELDVIKKICQGKQNKIIADELNCSLGLVKNRIASILSKTNLTDRTQIVIYAIKQGLLK